MRFPAKRKSGVRGSVLMETVLVLPALFLLILGVLQFAHIWMARQMTTYAAYAAARAMMVVPPGEQSAAASQAAQMVLAWMSLADEGDSAPGVSVPGWGKIQGSGSVGRRVSVTARNDSGTVTATVRFRFPLMMPGMAINRMIATAAGAEENGSSKESEADFYEDWNRAAGNPNLIDGWPYIELEEACSLPRPYSTADFPSGAFQSAGLTDG